MTTLSETLRGMLTQPTGHNLCDSGDHYGRAYQRNAKRDFDAEPQASLRVGGPWGTEISVSVYHHLNATLDLDKLCQRFNAMPCDDWGSDQAYGISETQEFWLQRQGFEFTGQPWNTYNWDNNFDQILQGSNLERDGDRYVLIQIHGGCDVRSGYTDAKLFKIFDEDYFLDDSCQFDLPREEAEAAGYPVQLIGSEDSDWITVDYHHGSECMIYDRCIGDDVEVPEDFFGSLPEKLIAGSANAVSH